MNAYLEPICGVTSCSALHHIILPCPQDVCFELQREAHGERPGVRALLVTKLFKYSTAAIMEGPEQHLQLLTVESDATGGSSACTVFRLCTDIPLLPELVTWDRLLLLVTSDTAPLGKASMMQSHATAFAMLWPLSLPEEATMAVSRQFESVVALRP